MTERSYIVQKFVGLGAEFIGGLNIGLYLLGNNTNPKTLEAGIIAFGGGIAFAELSERLRLRLTAKNTTRR